MTISKSFGQTSTLDQSKERRRFDRTGPMPKPGILTAPSVIFEFFGNPFAQFLVPFSIFIFVRGLLAPNRLYRTSLSSSCNLSTSANSKARLEPKASGSE